ncbi:MAG TPA: ester cyclase [Terriglobales bacterium]|nr:ester cyclase [Terriglobales bacterium]
MSEQNKALVQRVIQELVNKGDFSLLDELVASDYAYYEPTVGGIQGRDGYKSLVSMYRSAFPDMTLTINEQIAEGHKVVTHWTARGTHNGELMGVPPTGKQVTVQGVVISRIKDGKLIQDFESYDVHGMMRQLGVAQAAAKAA